MHEDVIRIIQHQIDSGTGDTGRLQFILDSIRAGKPLYQCDKKYLERLTSNFQREPEDLRGSPKLTAAPGREKKTLSEHLRDYRINTRLNSQNTIYIRDNEIEQKSEMATVILDLKNDLRRALDRIEVLENKLHSISDSHENKTLDFSLPEFIIANDMSLQEENSNDSGIATRNTNQNNSGKKEGINRFAKVLVGVTATVMILFLTTLFLFGTFEGKSTWEEYHLTFEQAKSIFSSFLFLLIVILVAWAVFGITNLATIVKKERLGIRK